MNFYIRDPHLKMWMVSRGPSIHSDGITTKFTPVLEEARPFPDYDSAAQWAGVGDDVLSEDEAVLIMIGGVMDS